MTVRLASDLEVSLHRESWHLLLGLSLSCILHAGLFIALRPNHPGADLLGSSATISAADQQRLTIYIQRPRARMGPSQAEAEGFLGRSIPGVGSALDTATHPQAAPPPSQALNESRRMSNSAQTGSTTHAIPTSPIAKQQSSTSQAHDAQNSPDHSIGLLEDSGTYWTASQLDSIAQPISQFEIADPRPGTQNGDGRILLDLYIGADGGIDRVEIDQSNMSSDVLDGIKRQFRQLRFTPGIRHGVRVRSVKHIDVCLGVCLEPREIPRPQ